MPYIDEEILEAKRKQEHQKYTTLETGMYAGDELITFAQIEIPDTKISLFLPEQFVLMPEEVKRVKYPSQDAPDYIFTSLDSTVNICINIMPILLKEKELESVSFQFQTALKNINPAIRTKQQSIRKTENGNDIIFYEYKGYHLDGQSYNRVYLINLRSQVLYGSFNCEIRDKNKWISIIDKLFMNTAEKE